VKTVLKNYAWQILAMGIVALVAVLLLVVPHMEADITSVPGTIPATTLDYYTNVTIAGVTGFTNTTLVPEAPTGFIAVKRDISISGTNTVNITSIPGTGPGATNTLTSGILLSSNDMISAWFSLHQVPYYDGAHVYTYSGVSNVATSYRVRMTCIPTPAPPGGFVPSGALGAGNIAVPQ
jgi:hypothetical protein